MKLQAIILVLSAVFMGMLSLTTAQQRNFNPQQPNTLCGNFPTTISFPACSLDSQVLSIRRYMLHVPRPLATVRDKLYAAVGGSTPVNMADMHAAVAKGKTAFEAFIKSKQGPSGLFLFNAYLHGAWFSLYGYTVPFTPFDFRDPTVFPTVSKGMMTFVIGNPLRLKDLAQDSNVGYGPFLVRPMNILLFDKGVPDECYLMWDKNDDTVGAFFTGSPSRSTQLNNVLAGQNKALETLMHKIAFE